MSEVHKIRREAELIFDPYFMYGNTEEGGAAIKRWNEGSNDPDGKEWPYSWYFCHEPSSYSGSVRILENASAKAKLAIPEDAGGKTIHIILEVRDNGTPELLAYRRMVLNVQ